MKIVMIVLNYNDDKTTRKLIEKVKDYQLIEKIIIVDNHSSDDSYENLKKIENEKIEVIQTESNRGYAYGNNVGIEYAVENYQPQYCIIANPDISFEENMIKRLMNEFKKDNQIAVVTAKMKNSINAWKLPTWFETIKSIFLLWNRYAKKYETLKTESNIVEVVSGSFFIIRSKAFMDVGKFDERTFLYCEENILAYKLKQKGYKTVLISEVEYEHHHSITIKKQYKSKVKPFRIYVKSIKIYHQYYLKTNILQNIIFNIFYVIALLERYLYDFIMKIRMRGLKGENK